jgi:hypothetical protein
MTNRASSDLGPIPSHEPFAPLCQGLDARFIKQEQFLKDSFVNPMTATVKTLAEQVGRIATKEEMGQLRSEITS